jgi:protein-disulfide isomerase
LAVGPTGEEAHADHSHEATAFHEELYEEISSPLPVTGREPSKGSVQAEWTVVEFTDYGCGHCADQAPIIQEVVKRHPKMKLLHKHYAFIGDGSRLAARAAVCAHEQGRFWEMNSALFDNMKRDWSAEDLVFLAKARANVSPEAFEACIANEAKQASVEEDYRVGESVGVRGTPAFYLSFDGSTWLKVNGGADAVDLILSAAEQGIELPGLGSATPGAAE